MTLPLRNYQEAAITAFMNDECRYLSADCGLGKTRMAIEIAKRMKAKRILVLCPASVKLAWISELKKWNPAAKFHSPVTHTQIGSFEPYGCAPLFILINYDKISRSNTFNEQLVAYGPYDLLICDEAQALKNLTSKRTRAVFRELAPVCKKVLPLSATPMTRCASDLYAPLRFLKPEAITDKHGHVMTLHAFEDQFTNVEIKRIGTQLVRQVSGSRNISALKERMGNFFYRLRKEDCLPELPPMQFELLPIGLNRDVYADLNDIAKDIDLDDEDLLTVASRDMHIMSAMKLIGLAKAEPASQYIRDYLDDNELKIVLWAKHHDTIDSLCTLLSHLNPAVIDGRVDQKGREAAVSSFLKDPTCRIFIGQIAAAGTGLTLLNETVQPKDVFFLESDWSPSLQYQAASRVHRIGQRDGVLVRSFVAQGVPLDMRLQNILNRKMREFEQLIDGENK